MRPLFPAYHGMFSRVLGKVRVAAISKSTQLIQKVTRGPGQAGYLGHHQHVAGRTAPQEFTDFALLPVHLAADRVRDHVGHAELLRRVVLEHAEFLVVDVLHVGRHAQVGVEGHESVQLA